VKSLFYLRSFFQFVGDLAELKEKDYGSGQHPASKRELFRPPAPEVSSFCYSGLSKRELFRSPAPEVISSCYSGQQPASK
jgi:hypothetical protein